MFNDLLNKFSSDDLKSQLSDLLSKHLTVQQVESVLAKVGLKDKVPADKIPEIVAKIQEFANNGLQGLDLSGKEEEVKNALKEVASKFGM